MKRTIAAILSFATALSLCACGGGSAATDSNAAADNSTAASGDTMVLRLANSHNAEHITSQACQRFADSVKEKTDGRITIECHFAGELGDERSTIEQCQFGNILRKSLRTIAMVMALIATASMFGWLLAYLKIPAMVTTALLGISTNKVVILLLINVMCLILGCIMDMGPLILILTPILLPVATQLGMEPVQFGAMLILNLAIGLCTPPVGAALFAGCSIGRIKIEHATKACLPFYAMMILVLMLVTFVQPISMFVPHLMAAMGN